jgi:CHAD domain-containing protein
VEPGEVLFNAATDPGQVFAALGDRYTVRIEPLPTTRWTCLDTADWRLHDAGMSLRDTRQGRGGKLLLHSGPATAITAPSPGRRWPQRAEGLPDSPVRERIAPAIGIRALLPLAEVEVHGLQLRVLDDEEKTRVRIEVDQLRLVGTRPAALPLRVIVDPVRGYERDGRRCADLLRDRLVPLAADTDATAAALAAAGHRPGEPAVAPARLDPTAPAPHSLVAVLRRWSDVIDLVRPGVLADVDAEFLHDLRTSVRATRSLLRLGAELLPDSGVTRFAGEFDWLGQLTAPLRDLDVALLELDGFGATDLTGLDDLETLRRYLRGQRRRALAAVRAGLESPRGRALSGDWRATLDAAARRELPAPSTRAAADAQAGAAYRRIVKAAGDVTDHTHPEELHRLRGRCKQMRYLLEGYAPVYAPAPHQEVLGSLRALQNCLGDIQDVYVQRAQLADVATTMTRRGAAGTVLAIGALRDRALHRDAEARRRLARKIARFQSPGTRALVAELGGAPAGAP